MMNDKIRWGVLSTGKIARKVVSDLQRLPDGEVVAVGSRSQESADRFGDEFEIPHRHASYEALVSDEAVDAIYIATPHNFHYANTRLCLEAGKAVLCEKPFTVNAQEAATLVALARERGVFLMEAMWTRFLPAMRRLRQLLDEEAVGELKMLMADFGFRASYDPQGRLFNPELAGGALLDVGVYPVSLASFLWGEPAQLASLATLAGSGVDEASGTVLRYEGGQLALLAAALSVQTPLEAHLLGTRGRITLHDPAFKPTTLTVSHYGAGEEEIHESFEGSGYQFQAMEVNRCLRAGRTESEIMPLDESVAIMRTLDRIRAQWGLRYPNE